MARSARRGLRSEAAAFLTRSQTKNVSAPSPVQDSGAQSWSLRIAALNPPTSSSLEDERHVPRSSSARRGRDPNCRLNLWQLLWT